MSYSVLIADDNPTLRKLLRKIIAKAPEFEILDEAENGFEAVEKVKELHPDIVLLDLQMPVMNGLQAAKEIKALALHTTIVLFTLYDTEYVRESATLFGVDIVIPKSSGSIQLVTTLRDLCARTPHTEPESEELLNPKEQHPFAGQMESDGAEEKSVAQDDCGSDSRAAGVGENSSESTSGKDKSLCVGE